jgi:hypothetical protein
VLHDRELLDRLTALSPIEFEGEVFRATRRGLDPLAPSLSGGRWMVRNGAPTLYTSAERDGALAEIVYYWSQLTPQPSKPVMLHRLRLSTRKTIRLAQADLTDLGLEWGRYEEHDYTLTQAIGAAVAHLEYDGLIAPSARWSCDNIMVFSGNSQGDDDMAFVINSEEVDWLTWAKTHGVAPSS